MREDEGSPASIKASISKARGDKADRGSGREDARVFKTEARDRSVGASLPLCCHMREPTAWQTATVKSKANKMREPILSHGRDARASAASDRGGKEGERSVVDNIKKKRERGSMPEEMASIGIVENQREDSGGLSPIVTL